MSYCPWLPIFWLEKKAKICIFKLKKAPKHDKKIEGSKRVHA